MKHETLIGVVTGLSLTAVQVASWLLGYQIHYGQWIGALLIPIIVSLFFGSKKAATEVAGMNETPADRFVHEAVPDTSQIRQEASEVPRFLTADNIEAVSDVRKAIVTIGNNARNVNAATKERVETMDAVIDKAVDLKSSFSVMVSQTSENLDVLGKTDDKLGRVRTFVEDGLRRTKTNIETASKLKTAVSEFSTKFEAIDELAATILNISGQTLSLIPI